MQAITKIKEWKSYNKCLGLKMLHGEEIVQGRGTNKGGEESLREHTPLVRKDMAL